VTFPFAAIFAIVLSAGKLLSADPPLLEQPLSKSAAIASTLPKAFAFVLFCISVPLYFGISFLNSSAS
jgi:hypothetical protein